MWMWRQLQENNIGDVHSKFIELIELCVSSVIEIGNARYHKNRCPGKITTVDTNVIAQREHFHAGDIRKVEKRIAARKIRKKAVKSNEPPRAIIRKVTSSMSTEAAIEMPNYANVARNIRRIRQKANVTPALPTTLAELVIDGEFTETLKGDLFVLYDNEDPDNRIVLFAP